MDFHELFQKMTGHRHPFSWQKTLAEREDCGNRLIRVATGMGKTMGVFGTWLHHRVILDQENWPRRLVWCLPMRTLVEQTSHEIAACLERLGLDVAVHNIMGGEDAGDWHFFPEKNAVLVGTQDMLISRALNRGYAMSRARWPMDFGLLNSDCLWVLDEVQLMDIGLATSAQLQWFREHDRSRTPRPSYSWWMSATLRPEWLKSVDTKDMVDAIEDQMQGISSDDRQGTLWTAVEKQLSLIPPKEDKEMAALVLENHRPGETTLVIVNTVKRAVAVFEALGKQKNLNADLRLVHSRFRPAERAAWRSAFLHPGAKDPKGRIIIATQVVEAGVDISAECLITDLAPWPSLVQRFGRAARYGGSARVLVTEIGDEKKVLPYSLNELQAAWAALENLRDVSLASLEDFQTHLNPEEMLELFPYAPGLLLMRRELEDLFDTTPDLTGADLDISRFIRSGDERDCHLFWRDLDKGEHPLAQLQPLREELCAAPIGEVRKWMDGSPKDKGTLFWRWDYLDGEWVRAKSSEVFPGTVLLCAAKAGGYSVPKGFSPKSGTVPVVPIHQEEMASDPEAAQDDESCAFTETWQTIAEHGEQVATELNAMFSAFAHAVPSPGVLELAAHWHDIGKAHPAFVSLFKPDVPRPAGSIAKAPPYAWKPGRPRYEVNTGQGPDPRPGFRHELASALALIDALRQVNPEHEALLGPWKEWFEESPVVETKEHPSGDSEALLERLSHLSASELNLLLYLIAAHHGKVRTGFVASPADQQHPVSRAGDDMPIRGIMEGDVIGPVELSLPDGTTGWLPKTRMTLEPATLGLSPVTGASWSQRCHQLLADHGPFGLAWLETLIRAADIRASRRQA